MDSADWQFAKEILAEALKRDASQREAYVRERCHNPDLAEEIVTLLVSYSGSDFLNRDALIAEFAEDIDDLEPGTRVGPYVIVDEIGRGGMGKVFLGSDPRLRRKVALKCVLRSLAGSGERRLRILHEARAAARVTHPNVATIHDVVEHEGAAFIVMEYLEGESLAARMRRGRLPIDRVVDIGRQLASALTAAHAKGVVHRDLKPGNIHIGPESAVKVLDFGIANAGRSSDTVGSSASTGRAAAQPATRTPQPGTPPYMSPEQLLGRAVDERSDLYSLGVVLFEMATGRRPFREHEAQDLVLAVTRGPAPRADAADAAVPKALADVIAKALEPDVVARYQSAAELGVALADVDALLQRKGSGGSELIRQRLTRLGAGMLMAPLALVSLGFMTSRTFNITLARTGPFSAFADDSLVDYFYWGLRSVVAPLVYVIAATVLVAAVRFLLRLLELSAPFERLLARVRACAAVASARLHLDDPVVLAQALATLGIIAIALVFWWFNDLNRAWAAGYVNESPPEWFRPLNPQNPARGYYRIVLTLMTFAFSVGLAKVIAIRRRRTATTGFSSLVLLAAVVAAMIALADLPYRLFNHSERERVDYGGARCYDLGQAGDQILVYCPAAEPPRNRVVMRSDPALHRLGIVESVFTLQPSSRTGQ
jgi:serine/threonine protein kinase